MCWYIHIVYCHFLDIQYATGITSVDKSTYHTRTLTKLLWYGVDRLLGPEIGMPDKYQYYVWVSADLSSCILLITKIFFSMQQYFYNSQNQNEARNPTRMGAFTLTLYSVVLLDQFPFLKYVKASLKILNPEIHDVKFCNICAFSFS